MCTFKLSWHVESEGCCSGALDDPAASDVQTPKASVAYLQIDMDAANSETTHNSPL